MRTRVGTCVLLLAVAVASAGCAPTHTTPDGDRPIASTSSPKSGDGVIRTDLAPVAISYPQLGATESVIWMSGTTGTIDLGPLTYWMDVVAVLPQAEMNALLALDDLVAVDAPSLVEGMTAKVSPGPFLGSPKLNEMFTSEGHYVDAVALDPLTRTVVLSGLFE